ncbi:MAG: UDP-glucose/GDP-mannose dehydrogenase family protein [bacterium]
MMKVSIIGGGYVGIVTGACLAEKGFYVTCVDIDKEKVEKINNCIPPIFERGLEDLLKKNVINKHLDASTDLKKAVMESEISIITVGTPFDGEKIDISYIKKAAEDIGNTLKEKNAYHVVVIKSTITPGTTDEVVLPILEKHSGKKAGVNFGVGVNPEFLREGCAVNDFMVPDRIVIGGIDKKTIDKLLELYKDFNGIDKLITNNKTAEMIKCVSNSLLATLISFSNEIANICALTPNVDIKEVMAGVHLDKRFNPILIDGTRVNPGFLSYLEAGCGFGGGCLPKDVKALISYAENKGENPKLLRNVIEVNQEQPNKLIQLLNKYYGSFKNLNVGVLGLAFKPDTDDMRESPAIPVIKSLLQKGAHIKAYDPVVKEKAKKIFGTDNIKYPESLNETLLAVDAVILITRWDEFKDLGSLIKDLKPQPLIIDGRRMLNKIDYKKYEGIGLNHEK